MNLQALCMMALHHFFKQAGSVDESEFMEMKDKLMEQESIIDDLQKEMESLRIISVQHKEQTHLVRYFGQPFHLPLW